MKRVVYVLAVLVVLVASSLIALPTSAKVEPGDDLQMMADGSEGVVASLCNYRVTITGRCKRFPNYCCK